MGVGAEIGTAVVLGNEATEKPKRKAVARQKI